MLSRWSAMAQSSCLKSPTYRHFSSTTLMTGRMPFCFMCGAGADAREPSPRNIGPSSERVNCAASRMVKGRTRTVTWMLDAPSVPGTAMFVVRESPRSSQLGEEQWRARWAECGRVVDSRECCRSRPDPVMFRAKECVGLPVVAFPSSASHSLAGLLSPLHQNAGPSRSESSPQQPGRTVDHERFATYSWRRNRRVPCICM
jgi:hypothetical protein